MTVLIADRNGKGQGLKTERFVITQLLLRYNGTLVFRVPGLRQKRQQIDTL